MSTRKRKSDVIDQVTTNEEKRTKNRTNFLDIDDEHCTEEDYQLIFHTLANRLINEYELVLDQQHCFRLSELEFYYYHPTRHGDTFAHRHPEQIHHSHWYFHRQGNSPTASYKGGTYKGLDITFGSSFGGILIRSIENKQTGKIYEGSCLVVDGILNLCQSQTIQELVQIKLKSNLNIFDHNQLMYLREIETNKSSEELIASPRVGLTLKVPSIDRERFLFRSYRFTPKDYYPNKMKITIILALAAMKAFANHGQFSDYAQDLVVQTNTRLTTVMTNLKDLQKGYDEDINGKSSPLVDFYKITLTTSNLTRAYGIWLRHYRTIKTTFSSDE